MSLNWNWNNKCGEATLTQTINGKERNFTLSLYNGNAYLIFLHEYQNESGQDVYDLHSFWADKEHMKRMLGLDKKHGYSENCHADGLSRITKFRLNKKKCRNFTDIVAAVAKAFDDVTIEIYSEEEEVI